MTPQEKAKQQAEVMLAYANGAEIEYLMRRTTSWYLCTGAPSWDWFNINFRVKKPAPKVVKLEAWIDAVGELRRFAIGGVYVQPQWKRVPSLDLEYVEDES